MKLHITLLLICMIGYASSALAQRDTIFYDKRWNSTPERKDAKYYRLLFETGYEATEVKDYYMDGTLQMEGLFVTTDTQMLSTAAYRLFRYGQFTYYYPDGKKESEGAFRYGQLDGEWTYYYEGSGKVSSVGKYKVGKEDSVWRYFDEEGKLTDLESYDNGVLDGYLGSFYPSGQVKEQSIFDKGERKGIREFFYPDGTLKKTITYLDGKEGEKVCYTNEGEKVGCEENEDSNNAPEVFRYVERIPEAPFNVNEYIGEHLRYPKEAIKDDIEGKIYVKFVVDEEGYITKVESVSPYENISLQAAAMNIVASMPRWKPGSQNGKNVKVYYTIPIAFRLEGGKSKKKKNRR